MLKKTVMIFFCTVISAIGSDRNLRRLDLSNLGPDQISQWQEEIKKHPCCREEEQLILCGSLICIKTLTLPTDPLCCVCCCASSIVAIENWIKKRERDIYFAEKEKINIKKIE